jgi:hypothetical protein
VHPTVLYDKAPQAIWNETTNRDATLHFELDVEEDIEGKLEHFCRMKRLGHFKDAEEYFQNYLLDQIDNLPIAVEYATMLLEQGAYKRLDELIQDGELNFSEEVDSFEWDYRTRELVERERKERGLREEDEAQRRAERIKAQDEEIRRRPSVPFPTTTTPHRRGEPHYVREEPVDPRTSDPARQHRGRRDERNELPEVSGRQPAQRGVDSVHSAYLAGRENSMAERYGAGRRESLAPDRADVTGRPKGADVDRGRRRAVQDDEWVEVEIDTRVDDTQINRLRSQLLRAELRLVVASANMYSHGNFKQVLAEMRVNRAALLALGDLKDEELDSIWV